MFEIVNDHIRKKNARFLSYRGVSIPTYSEMKNPCEISASIQERLKEVELDSVNPLNLYRITWKNEPAKKNGKFQSLPNFIEFPPELTGVKARIVALSGKFFPTGAHKVGSSLACLIPRVISGEFDLENTSAIWPSTGNFCRGGAFNSAILGCNSISVLPEDMSKERFDWLNGISGEVIKTTGSESNVKEIYDRVHRLKKERSNIIIFNQFCDFWNYLWHYEATSNAFLDLFESIKGETGRLTGICLSSGSSGTLGCADAIKAVYPAVKLAVGEALQCPTLLMNGYGEHRIEGVGDKHVPWIHNARNTDVVVGIDDNHCNEIFKLFNYPAGQNYLKSIGIDNKIIKKLNWCGISGIANLCLAIKFSKYFELSSEDIIFTILTDSSEMYQSRLSENMLMPGNNFTLSDAQITFLVSLQGIKTDYVEELSYREKKRIHNLKYYTWIEQQGMPVEELNRQWDDPDYWENIQSKVANIDVVIRDFNKNL